MGLINDRTPSISRLKRSKKGDQREIIEVMENIKDTDTYKSRGKADISGKARQVGFTSYLRPTFPGH